MQEMRVPCGICKTTEDRGDTIMIVLKDMDGIAILHVECLNLDLEPAEGIIVVSGGLLDDSWGEQIELREYQKRLGGPESNYVLTWSSNARR
jgi:hypothetical protein